MTRVPLTTLKGRDQMRRSWTDRDGVEWEVEVVGHVSTAGPSITDKHIQFRRVSDGYRIGTLYEDWGPVKDLSDAELQHLLDHAKRGAGEG